MLLAARGNSTLFVQDGFHISEHLVDGARGVYGAHLAVFLIQFNDWSGRLQVGLDSFLQAFSVVISASTALPSFKTSVDANLVTAVKEKHKFDICFVDHNGVPPRQVVLVSRETIYEETELFIVFLHGLFHCLPEQVDGDLHRDDPALLDVVVNELPKLGPLSGSLRPQQIPS